MFQFVCAAKEKRAEKMGRRGSQRAFGMMEGRRPATTPALEEPGHTFFPEPP